MQMKGLNAVPLQPRHAGSPGESQMCHKIKFSSSCEAYPRPGEVKKETLSSFRSQWVLRHQQGSCKQTNKKNVHRKRKFFITSLLSSMQ